MSPPSLQTTSCVACCLFNPAGKVLSADLGSLHVLPILPVLRVCWSSGLARSSASIWRAFLSTTFGVAWLPIVAGCPSLLVAHRCWLSIRTGKVPGCASPGAHALAGLGVFICSMFFISALSLPFAKRISGGRGARDCGKPHALACATSLLAFSLCLQYKGALSRHDAAVGWAALAFGVLTAFSMLST